MKRGYAIAAAAGAVVVAVATGAFFLLRGQTVDVKTGERVECTYGHAVSEDVFTLKVPAREASEYSVTTKKIVCDKHRRAEDLYREAQTALGEGDTKSAKGKLAKVVALDASFGNAAEQLEEITAGKTPQPSGSAAPNPSAGGSKPSKPGDKPSGPVTSLSGWMPDDIEGYNAEDAIADSFAISRQYTPKSGGKVLALVIAAEQFANADMAKKTIERDVKLPYNGKAVKVGSRSGWIGTNGKDVAVLGITDGAVRVIIQITTKAEDAVDFTSDLTKIASGLPR